MFGRAFSAIILVAALVLVTSAGASAASVGFEGLTLGTTYESPTYSQGDLIFTEDGIDATLEEYLWGAGNPTFSGFAMVGAPSTEIPGAGFFDFGSPRLLGISNISVEFDFTNLGFPVNYVAVQYANNGGSENISVNGGDITYTAISSAPANIAPGVTLATSFDGVAGYWTLELTGPVETMRIGGQEFAIDNVLALPEPTSIGLLGLGGLVVGRRRR